MSEPLHEPQAVPLAEVDRAFLETYIAPLVKPLSLYHRYRISGIERLPGELIYGVFTGSSFPYIPPRRYP